MKFSTVLFSFFFLLFTGKATAEPIPTKIYWFVPDGVMADPGGIDVFRWAQEGNLPNIKRLMEEGSYGYSIPDFPSHTPTNFATLMTGTHPNIHGVADGSMHLEGVPLENPSLSGFSSVAKNVPPFWTLLEDKYKANVVLLSIPGSTPPELSHGVTIRGRWGGWGADNFSVVFESLGKLPERLILGREYSLFHLGSHLTEFVQTKPASNWKNSLVDTRGPGLEAELKTQGLNLFVWLPGSRKEGVSVFDKVIFSLDKKVPVAELTEGHWSNWIPVDLKLKNVVYPSSIKLKVIKLWKDSNFRIRVVFSNINRLVTSPSVIGDELATKVGPMVDFADNWPHQLVFEPEDKATFLEESRLSWEWHKKAASFILQNYKPDVFIHDIYTPNLMLESRWWYRDIDHSRKDFSQKKSDSAMHDILEMYQGLDDIIGEGMKNAGSDALVVFSSDHGMCSLERLVKLNNLFAKKHWLKFTIDKKTGEPIIDWAKTKVIYLKTMNIYVNPRGLAGNWKHASGAEYEKLRNNVIAEITSLRDEDGTTPLVRAVKYEDAPKVYRLPKDRVGDILVEARIKYFWYEEMSNDLSIFQDSFTAGNKQAIDPEKNKCLWTPFVIAGPGIKKNFAMSRPISNADQVPTFLRLMNRDIPKYMQGTPIREIFIKKENLP